MKPANRKAKNTIEKKGKNYEIKLPDMNLLKLGF